MASQHPHYQGGSGFASRPGLSARQPLFGAPPPNNNNNGLGNGGGDQVAINIDGGFDLDDEIGDLRRSVGRLKQFSSAIHEENQLTRQVMEGLETALETARATMRQTMKRLDRVAKKTKSGHVIYVFIFGIVLFFTAYFWTRVYRFLSWLF